MFCKFHISRPRVVEKLGVVSFAIMDDLVLRVGTVSFQVLLSLDPDRTPEESFVLNMGKIRHAAYLASRKTAQPAFVDVDLECFATLLPMP
ncbi:hypothetical protein WJ542_28230 [Paraburkholderia sp. B3]|uniref:hypothetical protein n=1 Tax=Paraburkholderia sp. B3 TaxID=3134791 RepID=UPI0039821C4F